MAQSQYPYIEFSGGMQEISTPHLRKANEVYKARNADFTVAIGAFVRRLGAQKYDSTKYPTIPQQPIDKPTLGAAIALFPNQLEVWHVSNVSGDATSTLRRWDSVGLSWVSIQTGMLAGAEVNFQYDLKEMFVSSYVPSTDTLGTPFSVDPTHSVSTTRQLQFGPLARFYIPFNGFLYAANCSVAGTRYPNRLYQSSGPTGVVAFARSAQTDVPATVTLMDNVPTMSSNTTPIGVAAASSSSGSGNAAYMVFDDNLTSAWETGGSATTGWVSYDFGSGNAKVIPYYSMTAIGPAEPNPSIAPQSWTFQGSNDNSTWTTLDTETSVPAWANSEKRVYTTTNTTAYRYYRINVSANQGFSTILGIYEAELLTSTGATNALQLQVDSARYIKPGQILDAYTAGTNTKLFSITVATVDKINDLFTFQPWQENFATTAVNTSTDVITLPDATEFPTGTPIRFLTTSGLPAPLVSGTTYYAINTSGTTIKVATNLQNAQLAVAVDITTQGTGTHTILISYTFGNKDELWGSGRKGLLTRYWNTDYRDPTTADWLDLPATLDASNSITAVGTINARLFVWTESSMSRYDGANLIPMASDVGCIAMKTVAYYGSNMVWLDAKGRVWNRNDAAGTQAIISIPVKNTIKLVPMSSLSGATAVCVGQKYKLTLGQVTVGGQTKTLRLVYDFEANVWTTEFFTPQMLVQLEYRYSGTILPHFFDEHSNMWVDELGNDDAGVTIPMDVEIGQDTMQIVRPGSISLLEVDQVKKPLGAKVYGTNCVGTKLLMKVDSNDWFECGELKYDVSTLQFPANIPKGTLFDLRFTNSSTGDPVRIDKAVIYFNIEEDTLRATRK